MATSFSLYSIEPRCSLKRGKGRGAVQVRAMRELENSLVEYILHTLDFDTLQEDGGLVLIWLQHIGDMLIPLMETGRRLTNIMIM